MKSKRTALLLDVENAREDVREGLLYTADEVKEILDSALNIKHRKEV